MLKQIGFFPWEARWYSILSIYKASFYLCNSFVVMFFFARNCEEDASNSMMRRWGMAYTAKTIKIKSCENRQTKFLSQLLWHVATQSIVDIAVSQPTKARDNKIVIQQFNSSCEAELRSIFLLELDLKGSIIYIGFPNPKEKCKKFVKSLFTKIKSALTKCSLPAAEHEVNLCYNCLQSLL